MDNTVKYDFIPDQHVPQPKCVNVQLDFEALTITYRWWSPNLVFLLIFTLAWDSSIFFMHEIISVSPPWLEILIPCIYAAIGIWLTYRTIASFINRTTIAVNRQRLSVAKGPLPWFGDKLIEIARISQLYSSRERDLSNLFGLVSRYQLNLILHDETERKLLSCLPTPDVAFFVEQSIEEYLHIKNRPVRGELTKESS